ALVGFAIVVFVTGLCTAMVFRLAHVVEGTSFDHTSRENQQLQQERAIHQLQTTANFATNSKIISWMVGGRNFQIEHHLFPRISHVHYPQISQLVKETCDEYQIKYLEYNTMLKAIGSHFSHIRKMGKLT